MINDFDVAPEFNDTGNCMKIVIFATFPIDFDDAAELKDTGNLMKIMIFTTFPIDFDDAPVRKDTLQFYENRDFDNVPD